MINHRELLQCTLDWYEIRWGKIGGTLSSGLLIKSDTLFLDILSQQIEEFELEESYESQAMIDGRDNEVFAVEYLESYFNVKFERPGWLQSVQFPLLGISPDGLTEDETIACEVKCLKRKAHTSVLLENDIPMTHRAQCVHYFTVNPKLEKLYFMAFRPNSVKHFVKEITRSTKIDLGWTEKSKVKEDRGLGIKEYVCSIPVIKTVAEWADIAQLEAVKLQEQINESIKQIQSL